MKKLSIVLAALLMATSACQAESWNFMFNKDKIEQEVEAETKAPENNLKAHIQAIYDDVRKNYPAGHSEPPKKVVDLNATYCSSDWNRMVESVVEKDKKNKEEVGFFDADYWIMGQDWGDLTPVNIQVTMQGQNRASVSFEMDPMGGGMKLVQLEMVMERGAWRIDNFIDRKNGLDWKENMREYLGR